MMNKKAINIVRNFSYTITSNFINMMVTALVVFIVPKLLGVDQYGYWQLFLFYSSYVPFLLFGWTDGIYLRYGGKKYSELDKSLLFSQFLQLLVIQVAIGVIIWLSSSFFLINNNKIFIFKMVSLFLVIVNIRYFFVHILQSTNQFKIYTKIVLIDRLFYLVIITVFLLIGIRDFELLIISELIAKSLSLLYAILKCSDIFFQKVSKFYFSFKETFININVGVKLMLANTASMLIIGVNRFGIEKNWDVATFGKVSLTLNISNFMMIFINAVGLVLFPVLRRTPNDKLPQIYTTLRTFLMLFLFMILIIFYPLKFILSVWLPNYADSLAYMVLLLPMCVFEGKMALLINTYLKTLRKESLMLTINIISLLISVIISFITIELMQNLDLAIVSIILSLALRGVIAELFLSRIINISVRKDLILEIAMVAIFIATGWYFVSWLALIIYLIAYGAYVFLKRRDIRVTIQLMKVWVKA